jgi:hypothetical protein
MSADERLSKIRECIDNGRTEEAAILELER